MENKTVEMVVKDLLLADNRKKKKLSMGNPSQSYGASLSIWDHTVLPATRHK